MTEKKVTVIGDGGWGTALALTLNDNGADVTVWSPFTENVKQIIEHNENVTYLKGIPIPNSIKFTNDKEKAAHNADLVILATPTKFYKDVAVSFKNIIPKKADILSVAKGFDNLTKKRMSEIASDVFNRNDIAVLSGPSHAEEVAKKIPTCVTIASQNTNTAKKLQKLLSNKYFRAYTSSDVIGVELGGALKNIIAIAVGVSDGLNFGDNTRAALITRGLAEITRLGVTLGADKFTFSGLSGIGDLIVTCTSKHSRNRFVGEMLGKGHSIKEILSTMKQVAEGVWNCPIALELAKEFNIDVPITNEINNILNFGKSPLEATESLLNREYKSENTLF